MTSTSTEIAIPVTGELVSLEDAAACGRALGDIRRLEQHLRDLKTLLTDSVVAECQRQGTKTLRLDDMTLTMSGGETVQWDIEVLEQLLDAGLPQERFDALVKTEVTYKVSAAEAKRLAVNPEYADIIEKARTVLHAPFRVSVSGGQ